MMFIENISQEWRVMKQVKYYLFIPLFFLLFLVDAAIILGFFYCNIFRYTDHSSLGEIDSAYQDTTVLDETFDFSSSCKYIFFKTTSEEYYVVVLEKSQFYDRYRYVPSCTVQISDERPYSEIINVPNNQTEITIDESNTISYLNVSGTMPRLSSVIQIICIAVLFALEIIAFGIFRYFYEKHKKHTQR